MIIMAVDFGRARTGVAVCDKGETLAFPSCVITEYDRDRLIEKLSAKASELSAELIVAGLPKNMDGSEGEKAEECRENAELLEKASGIKVEMWDERCTTVIAHKALSENGKSMKKHKDTVDAVAATVILEGYLSFRKNK